MLQLVGIATILYVLYCLFASVYRLLLRNCDLKRYKKRDSWAVITGATDGIGLGFAHVLARQSFNCLLVSRSEEKLKRRISELKSVFKGVKFDYVVSDAANLQSIDAVVEKTREIDVAMLVNNVGMGQGAPGRLETIESEILQKMITVNCTYPLLLSRALLPILRQRSHPGAIINLSSVAAHIHCPFNSTYSATKAFNRLFSLSLSGECADGSMITVLSVEPGFVATNMTNMQKGVLVCDAEECAEGALRQLGLIQALPHWKHWITLNLTQAILQRIIPESFQPAIDNRVLKYLAAKRFAKTL